jgi:maltooligosyltrehalose trehalohydrolase
MALHRDLIRLRRDDPVLADPSATIDGAVIGQHAFVIRFFDPKGSDDRLLLVNIGHDLSLSPIPEPLLAEPEDCDWRVAWSSDDPRYGGLGMPPPSYDADWILPGNCAILLTPQPRALS